MTEIAILVVEDEPEVRDAIERDLAPFQGYFRIEAADDVADARDVVRELATEGIVVGLVLCDHLLPGTLGTDFLVELHGDAATRGARKVLLTGQAGLEDTIRAVNEAGLDHYVPKPWTAAGLQGTVREQLTEFVLEGDVDVLPYVPVLDGPRLVAAAADRGWEGRRT
ncbi:MAG: response regulator [Actinobacteria bacterium]|nr:response regulator [Actinomycetota bacterium]